MSRSRDTADQINRVDSSAANATAITIDSSENVGIGTAAPNANLHTAGSSTNIVSAQVQNTEGTGSRLDMYAFGSSPAIQSAHRAAVYQWTGAGIDMWSRTGDLHFGTSNAERMRIDATGAVTMPHQPAFLVTKNSDQNNIATGSEVTVTWQAEVFDQNSDFASNVFTAPVTGKYLLTSTIRVDNLDTASNYYNFLFTTSNRVYRKIIDYGGLSGDPVYWFFSLTAIADMDAGDTASVKIYQNNGTAQMDIIGDVTRSYFSGYLVA